MKKLFKVILCMAIILSNFSPLLSVKVKAAGNYTVAIAYATEDVVQETNLSYSDALAKMNTYASTDQAVAVIKNSSGRIVNAKYAIAEIDYVNGVKITTRTEGGKYLYSTPQDAVSPTPDSSNLLALVASTWGADSAFLDYNETYNAVKVKISGVTGWLDLGDVGIIPISKYYGDTVSVNYPGNSGKFRNDTYYYVYNNVLYHQIHMGVAYPESFTTLGTAPYYYDANGTGKFLLSNSNGTRLSADVRYYSFDSNYFYSSFTKMIDDYKSGVYNNAINASYPYYSYFMYLPSHTITNYVAGTFNLVVEGRKFTSATSKMYGIGNDIIDAANAFKVNGLTLFSVAAVESATGTSEIAFAKNNLYGMGAYDGNPYANADTYTSVRNSIMDYANRVGQTSYANIYSSIYRGTHLGNKLSGISVKYATDPYSGEAKAGQAYWINDAQGKLDASSYISAYSYTLGITKNSLTTTKIYSEPKSSSSVIYETKNYSNNKVLTNMPFIVTNKVTVIDGGQPAVYYKVYTDVSLTSTRTLTSDTRVMYNFANCYGYIKESDLYVANNQPKIIASNRTVTQHDSVDLLANVTATDTEDGNLTSSVTVSNKGSFDVEKPGSYTITYTVMDKSKYSVSKDITITVEPSGIPTIVAPDITIPQYKSFDPKTGVTVEDIDAADKDLINKLTVTGTVDVSTIGDYILTYMVTDAAGSTTTETRKVTVVANEKPVINATNLTVYKGQTFNYSNGVTATDKEDGNVTSSLTYTGTVDMTTNGTYEVTYSATDLDNQTSSKIVTITVEDKIYKTAASMFYLSNLTYNTNTKKVDFTGYLTIKGMNNTAATNIAYDIIFENQNNGNTIIKPLSRLTSNVPFAVPNSGGFDYSGSWFKESLDLSDLVSGDYTVYVRARSGDYEAKVLLKNEYFNTNVARKFTIDSVGYQFRINYYNRALPLELFVRSSGLVSSVNNPTIDNMYNQVYSIKLEGTTFKLQASSHNVKGNYASSQTIERYVMFENIDTLEIAKTVNVGAITNGPYRVNLKVSDGYDKTKVWYNTNIDLSDLPKGTYSVIVRTKAGAIDDYGELYDALYLTTVNQSITNQDGKKITVTRNNDLRFRIEITVE